VVFVRAGDLALARCGGGVLLGLRSLAPGPGGLLVGRGRVLVGLEVAQRCLLAVLARLPAADLHLLLAPAVARGDRQAQHDQHHDGDQDDDDDAHLRFLSLNGHRSGYPHRADATPAAPSET